MPRLSSPRLIQWNRLAERSKAGEASSRMAITAISMPRLRAPSRTRKGKSPFPAISPHAPVLSALAGMQSLFGQAAVRGGFNEPHKCLDVLRAGEGSAHFFDGLRSVQFRAEKISVGLLDGLNALRGKTTPFEPTFVDSIPASFAGTDDLGEGRDVLCDDGAGANVRVAADARELVQQAERTDG